MTTMTGAQAIINSLKQYGVDTIFGLPGWQLDNVFDALYDEQDSIRVIHTRHEQAVAYMAFGYAQSTGRAGVCLVVPGPGLLNASAAILTAYSCNVPVLVLAGQVPSNMIDKGFGHLHELQNQLEMIGSVTKWAARINSPAKAPGFVREAFKNLYTGRPRPVELEMSPDIMEMKEEVELLEAINNYELPEGDPDLIETAAKILAGAKNPMIFVGGGAHSAAEEVLDLAEALQAPVPMSVPGKGVISDRHYLAQNRFSAREFWKKADVALVVGTRFTEPLSISGWDWGWDKNDNIKIIQIDIDPEQIGRIFKPEIGIIADGKKCLTELIKRIEKYNSPRESRREELLAARETSLEFLSRFQPQASYAEVLRQELPEDGIMVSEQTQVGYFCNVCFPVYYPRTYIQSGYQGNLGSGFATALGVKVANPDKKVISINGDGGFMYTSQELSTALLHNINLVAVVFTDNAFGNVRRTQEQFYNGRTIASDLLNPDFVKYAESFGVVGVRAESPAELRKAIREGFDNDVLTLIEVPIGEVPFLNMY